MQASAAALTRAQGPAHFHAQPAAPNNDPLLELVRVVQNHHGTGQHQHTQVERHRHDADANDVITVGDDAPDADAMNSADSKRAVADLDAPVVVAAKAHVHACAVVALAEPACAFSSHIAALLERPPR